MNIRNETDCTTLIAKGYVWACTLPRDEIGKIVSKHRTYEAAEKAAKGRELAIRDLRERHL